MNLRTPLCEPSDLSQRSAGPVFMDAGASFPFFLSPSLSLPRKRGREREGQWSAGRRQEVCETSFGRALRSAPPEAGEASAPVGLGAAPPGAPPQASLRSLRPLEC